MAMKKYNPPKKKQNPHKTNLPRTKTVSQAELNRSYNVARKVLRFLELDPNLIDVFTKKQKSYLLHNFYEPPTVKADKPNTVPRQYVRNIYDELYEFLKTTPFGDPDIKLTYIEFLTYGLNFLSVISAMHLEGHKFESGSPQAAAADQICAKYDIDELRDKVSIQAIFQILYLHTRGYSRINFRCYGFTADYEQFTQTLTDLTYLKLTIRLTAHDCEAKKFTYNNIERKAFKMVIPAIGAQMPESATVKRRQVIPSSIWNNTMNIYIQSHVLRRFKERADVFDPNQQNIILQFTFSVGLKLVKTGNQVLFACAIEGKTFGYFAFFVQGNDVVITTFLPFTSSNTPEGQKLHQLTALSKDEIIYLGMDKLSFYPDVDFDQIPVLKKALIDSNIWETKLELDNIHAEDYEQYDDTEKKEYQIKKQKKTQFVKNFFDRRDEIQV
jgi:hypothetical protein